MAYIDDLLTDNEHIEVRAHRHVLFLILNSILWVLAGLALIAVGIVLWRWQDQPLLLLLFLALSLYPLGVAGYRFLAWKFERYLITNFRIIQVEGIVNRKVFDTSLEKVNDVQFTQSLFGRMFGYGNISIITGSEIGVNHLTGIASPTEFKRNLQRAKLALSGDYINDRFQPQSTYAPQAQSGMLTQASRTAAGVAATAHEQAHGAPGAPPNATAQRLMQLRELLDSGLITAEEYEQRRRTLIQEL